MHALAPRNDSIAGLARCAVRLAVAGVVVFAAARLPAAEPPAALQLDEEVLPLAPKRERSEQEEDRLHAAALFAAGRMLEQKGEAAAALARYERAYRYDDDAVSILREIIPLAFSAGRSQEAVRYALLAAEQDPSDTALLRRLALYLAEQNDWERSLRLYELVLKEKAKDDEAAESVVIHMEIGRIYFLTENFKKAAEMFAVVDQALQNPEQFGLDAATQKAVRGKANLTYLLFAESYLAAGKYDEAIAAFKQADAAQPNRGLLAYRLARVEAKQNNPAEALNLLRDYFDEKLRQEGTEPYELLVKLLTDLNQQATIDEQLAALQTADPDNPMLNYFLASRWIDEKKYDQAEPPLRGLIASQDDDAPRADAYEKLIELYLQTGANADLLDVLGEGVTRLKTLEPFEEDVAPLVKDAPRLQQLFQLARERRKESKKRPAGEALAVAQLALLAEDFDAAAEFFPWALTDDPDRKAEILLTWGLELFLAEEYDAAAEIFQRGVDEKVLPKDNPAFAFYLAGALEMAGKTDAALAAARQAAAAQPDSAEFAARPAWILYHAERYDEARKAYLELLEKFDDEYDSDSVRDVMREARLVLSNIDVAQGKQADAEEWLEQVLDEFPEDIGAMNDLGYLWAEQNKHLNRAVEMLKRATAAEPDNQAYQDSYGWALYRVGRYEDAVKALEKAAEGDEPDGVILDHLGDAYDKLGRHDQARETWLRSAAAFEREGEKEKAESGKRKAEGKSE